jgi:hypothetical protein
MKQKLILICLQIVLISMQDRSRFAPNVPWAWKLLWAHPMVLLCNVCQVEACIGPFRGNVNLSAR